MTSLKGYTWHCGEQPASSSFQGIRVSSTPRCNLGLDMQERDAVLEQARAKAERLGPALKELQELQTRHQEMCKRCGPPVFCRCTDTHRAVPTAGDSFHAKGADIMHAGALPVISGKTPQWTYIVHGFWSICNFQGSALQLQSLTAP